MKKGQIGVGVVCETEFPNKGILYMEDGEKVIVKNVLAGQKILFSIQKKRKGKSEGRLLEILEQSPLEMDQPACVHHGTCGGCLYQTLEYADQLKLKEQQVFALLCSVIREDGMQADPIHKPEDGTDSLEHVQAYPAWFEGIKPSPKQYGYRNKMEFSFGDEYKDGPLALGLHRRNSFYDLITTDQCRIADTDYNLILRTVLQYFSQEQCSYFKKHSHEGYLRHLLVRKAEKTGEILIDLVTTSQACGNKSEAELLNGFCETLREQTLSGTIIGILHTRNDSVADVVKDEGTEILYGRAYLYEELLGLTFQISVFSFFQTNSLGAEVLYETVRQFIGNMDNGHTGLIYDLYSGTGTIAQILAPKADRVIGVEIVEEAVLAARENARMNGLENCAFICGDVLEVLDAMDETPDFIILDPPREGVHPKALRKILHYGVERMVYISCKPTSLVRDLEVILESGYRVERVCCVDLFPGAVHVETVVLLSQQKPDDTIEIDLDLYELDATSAETKATYQEIKDYVLKEFGLKVSSLYISQIKRKCGIEVGENYNLPKSENARVPQCPKEKEDAIKAALKYFAMI